MNTLWYLAMLIGVIWLMAWLALPDHLRQRVWWPFDMRKEGAEASPARPEDATGQPAGRSPAGTSWRDRARTRLATEPAAAPAPPHPRRGPPTRSRAASARGGRRGGQPSA